MKVFAIANNIFSYNRILKSDNDRLKLYNFSQLPNDTFDKITFTAKGPAGVNPSRKVFERLAQEILSCPCCGRKMIPPSEIDNLRASHALKCKAPDAVKVLSKYENKMHSVEKEVFNILKEESKQHPDMDFKEILQHIKPKHEKPLIKTQFGIFKLLDKACENMSIDTKNQVKELISEETNRINNGNNEFRRKRFVNKFEEIFKNKKNSAAKEHLIRIAKKLPTAYEDKNAFIVKYSSRPAEEIGIRLLSYSMRTIEHVKPKNRQGENHLFNYIPECMRCNSFRQDRPMIQQLEEYPEMFANAQNLMDKLVIAANNNQISKWYILKIQQNIFNESDKVLKLNISDLKMDKNMRKEYLKINSTAKDKKITKKELKKEKIKEQHKIKAKSKKDKTKRV